MLRALLAFGLSVVGLSFAAAEASAVDWSIKGTASEAVELNDNQFLKTMLAGGSLGSYSTIDTNVEARTPTSKFDLDTFASYRKYWGPGIDNLPSEYINYSFKGRYELLGKTTTDKTYIESSYGQQSAALAVFNTTGLPSNSNALLNQATVRGGLDRSLTSQDLVSLWIRSIYTDYDPSNAGIAFTDTLAVGTWKHRLNSILVVTGQSEIEYLSYQNVLNSRALIVRNLAGVEATLSPLLSIRASGGYAHVETENVFGALPTLGGLPPVASAIAPTSTSASDFISNILLTYRPLKSTTVYLEANRSIGPSIIGSIIGRTNVRAGMDYDINSVSKLSFYADFARLIAPATTDFALASVSYSREITKTWTARVSYSFLHRFTTGGSLLFDPILGTPSGLGLGPASSNSILMVFSKTFVALPPGT